MAQVLNHPKYFSPDLPTSSMPSTAVSVFFVSALQWCLSFLFG